MLAAKAARPRQRRTAGRSGDLANRGASRSRGQLESSRVPPRATKATKATATARAAEGAEAARPPRGQRDLAGVDPSVGRHTDRDREQEQGEDVVDDRGAE